MSSSHPKVMSGASSASESPSRAAGDGRHSAGSGGTEESRRAHDGVDPCAESLGKELRGGDPGRDRDMILLPRRCEC
jgi:hypothetical protein